MSAQTYPAADLVAPKIYEHLARHLDEARERGETGLASLPSAYNIADLVEAGFWASLRHEEGYVSKISLAFLEPAQAPQPMIFERSLPLDPAALAKVAPAVERAGIHLGVWPIEGTLRVWGTTASIPSICFVLEVAAPGLLVVKHKRSGEDSKFINVAVLEGEDVKLIDEKVSNLPDSPPMLTSLLGFDSRDAWGNAASVLVQLAVSMRAHGRGGSLLIVPAGSDVWRQSVVQPLKYESTPPFAALADLRQASLDERSTRTWQDALARAIAAIAGLTAVDGATVVATDYRVMGFGAKIVRRKGLPQVPAVTVTEPIAGGAPSTVEPASLGGTRHLSAAQFVHDQRDSIALVASQDGNFTVFTWSPSEDMVHAHRVEALLL